MGKGNTIRQRITSKLQQAFAPAHIDLTNESHLHSVPAGSETHFRLILVSDKFSGKSRVARSRLVYECLHDEMKNGVHALAQRIYTTEEWADLGGSVNVPSPPCHGGET